MLLVGKRKKLRSPQQRRYKHKGETMRGRYGNGFHAFSEYDGFSMIDGQKKQIVSDINSQTDDYILNVNKTEFIEHLVSKYTISPVEIHRDQITVSTYEKQISSEMFPFGYHVREGKTYPKDVIKYHLPFTGDPQLLKVRASTYSLSAPLITAESDCICFEIVNFDLEPERIKQYSDQIIKSLIGQNQNLTNEKNKTCLEPLQSCVCFSKKGRKPTTQSLPRRKTSNKHEENA